jgi:hypothetical protein
MTSILARAGDIAASLVSRHVRDSDHVLSGLPMRPGLVVTPVPKVPFWKFRNFNVLQPNLVITS